MIIAEGMIIDHQRSMIMTWGYEHWSLWSLIMLIHTWMCCSYYDRLLIMGDDMLIIAMNRLVIMHDQRHNHVIMNIIVNPRSKCVETMISTQAGQSGAVGTKSAPPGPSQDLRGPKRGLLGPKRTLFACFLELSGSIWALTVLNEPGIPLRRSGPPTSLYLEQKEFPKKLGGGNLGIGPK